MPKGIVQYFLKTKGYGYIRVSETREEFYVHKKNLLEPIQKGDIVEFEIAENKHGMYAIKVCILQEG